MARAPRPVAAKPDRKEEKKRNAAADIAAARKALKDAEKLPPEQKPSARDMYLLGREIEWYELKVARANA